jgi:hypothetical protein
MAKKYINNFAKYGGLVTVFFEWFALLFFYLREPVYFTGEHPISYFATLPQTRIVFTVFYLIAAVSFWIFAKHHLQKHYQVPVKIFAFSMISFAGLALFPYDPANTMSTVIHNILAQSSFCSFLLGMYLMAKKSRSKRLRIITIFAVILSALLMISFIITPKDSHLVLGLEAGSWLVFQLWIIWVSYRSYRNVLT